MPEERLLAFSTDPDGTAWVLLGDEEWRRVPADYTFAVKLEGAVTINVNNLMRNPGPLASEQKSKELDHRVMELA